MLALGSKRASKHWRFHYTVDQFPLPAELRCEKHDNWK